ncbi:MAG: hypothetical protein V4525_11860 [Pseudomonadota bacterium]
MTNNVAKLLEAYKALSKLEQEKFKSEIQGTEVGNGRRQGTRMGRLYEGSTINFSPPPRGARCSKCGR